jgi:hypothetical protein
LDLNINKIKEEIQLKENAIREKISEEAPKKIAAELRRSAEERLQRVIELRKKYLEYWEQFLILLKDWIKIADDINNLHGEISSKREKRKAEIESRLNKFSSKEIKITLGFIAGDDKKEFETFLKDSGILKQELHGKYKSNRWPEKISTAWNPIYLAKALLLREKNLLMDNIQKSNQEVLEDYASISERLINTLDPFGIDDDADIKTVDDQKLKNILKMAEIDWDDIEGILLNDRPVENLSPGQRSSAMLPLIALTENVPLVIDQPEDNLDNRLIGKMLVNILADLKEKRQIIVATHNPNIVVSGDAEQVIVLEALSNSKGKCYGSGSIDNKEIIDSVLEIMEGGKEAFLARRRRYNLAE